MNHSIVNEAQRLLKLARQPLTRVPGARRLKRALSHALASPEERLLLEAYDIGMTQRRSEIRALANLVRELHPERILEIGTSRGGTFYLWTQLAGDETTLISVDLPQSWALDDPEEALKRNLFQSFQRGRQTLHFVRRDSHLAETRREVLSILAGIPLDFLFIDGDHSYEGVRRDFLDYGPMVRPGGVVALHDILPHSEGLGGEVPRFWAEIREDYQGIELVEDRQLDGFGIGVIIRPPSFSRTS
jgi:predicted O-methyltransferase YrrM